MFTMHNTQHYGSPLLSDVREIKSEYFPQERKSYDQYPSKSQYYNEEIFRSTTRENYQTINDNNKQYFNSSSTIFFI